MGEEWRRVGTLELRRQSDLCGRTEEARTVHPGAERAVRHGDERCDARARRRTENPGLSPRLTDLVRAGKHGVSLEYVRGMKNAGYKFDDLEALTKMRD